MENSETVYNIPNKVEIKQSNVHGLGVFAKETIQENETIEVSRLLRLGWRMKYQYDNIIRDYCWTPNCKCSECQMHGTAMYLALGCGSIYNHDDNPNTNIKLDYTKLTLTVIANKTINAGEEIFVTYGESYWKTRPKTS
jgi:SET domain-containing protein